MPLVRCMLGSLRVRCRPRCRHRKMRKSRIGSRRSWCISTHCINVNCSVWTSTLTPRRPGTTRAEHGSRHRLPSRVRGRTAPPITARHGPRARPRLYAPIAQSGVSRHPGGLQGTTPPTSLCRVRQSLPSTVHQLHHVSRGVRDRRDTTHPSAFLHPAEFPRYLSCIRALYAPWQLACVRQVDSVRCSRCHTHRHRPRHPVRLATLSAIPLMHARAERW